jgi:hypothetical protein
LLCLWIGEELTRQSTIQGCNCNTNAEKLCAWRERKEEDDLIEQDEFQTRLQKKAEQMGGELGGESRRAVGAVFIEEGAGGDGDGHGWHGRLIPNQIN